MTINTIKIEGGERRAKTLNGVGEKQQPKTTKEPPEKLRLGVPVHCRGN